MEETWQYSRDEGSGIERLGTLGRVISKAATGVRLMAWGAVQRTASCLTSPTAESRCQGT